MGLRRSKELMVKMAGIYRNQKLEEGIPWAVTWAKSWGEKIREEPQVLSESGVQPAHIYMLLGTTVSHVS